MKIILVLLGVAAAIVLALLGTLFYFNQIANPRVARELIAGPHGARAQRVMLLTLPSGRDLPVNCHRAGDLVYAAADGGWWKELVGDGFRVTVLVRGETLAGQARAVLDDPAYQKAVFSKLRPDALPGFGTLVEIRLAEGGSISPE